MTKQLALITLFIGALTAPLAAQGPRPQLTEIVAQPATWVPFQSTVEEDGVRVGRFWRDANGSTRLELDAPDPHGRMIVIQNVPQARYYVYRPEAGWTVQPMWLPTGGWQPLPMRKIDVGTVLAEAMDMLPVYERTTGGTRERRAPGLNFFPLVRARGDGTVETHRGVRVGEVPASLFAPPPGAVVTELAEPAGIVAVPSAPGGGER